MSCCEKKLGKMHCELSDLHETYINPLTWMPYDGDFLFIIYGMVWANMIHNVGGKIFGDPVSFLPLGGSNFAAQEQQILYTYHKWRGGQRGVGYFVYHD